MIDQFFPGDLAYTTGQTLVCDEMRVRKGKNGLPQASMLAGIATEIPLGVLLYVLGVAQGRIFVFEPSRNRLGWCNSYDIMKDKT